MKVLWHSNAPWSGTGYGVQTDIFTQRIANAGHDVLISAFYGLQGAKLTYQPRIAVLPGSLEEYGNDILPAHWDFHKPDVALALMDVWVLLPETLRSLPLAVWCPIDHEPMPPVVEQRLRQVRYPIAMSRFGEREMRRAGLDPFYVPHGVDTQAYQPTDMKAARARLGWDDEKFIAVNVAANKGTRKNLDRLLKAWSQFVSRKPNSFLYLHTLPTAHMGGHDLYWLVDFYEIPRETIGFADPYLYQMGAYGTKYLNDVYNAANVFVTASAGEGFGVPILDAQAAGCPVIVPDFSAMSELMFSGELVPMLDSDKVMTPQGSEQVFPHAHIIRSALESAWAWRNDPAMRRRARDRALEYDADRVFNRYMLPVLECIAELNKVHA